MSEKAGQEEEEGRKRVRNSSPNTRVRKRGEGGAPWQSWYSPAARGGSELAQVDIPKTLQPMVDHTGAEEKPGEEGAAGSGVHHNPHPSPLCCLGWRGEWRSEVEPGRGVKEGVVLISIFLLLISKSI